MKKKIFIPVSLIVLVIIIVWVFLQNLRSSRINPSVLENTSTTSSVVSIDWKEYRNEQYGFKISYPSNWFLDEYNDSFVRISNTPTSTNMHGAGTPSGIWVEIQKIDDSVAKNGVYCVDTHGTYVSTEYEPTKMSVCYGKKNDGLQISANMYPKDVENQEFRAVLGKIIGTFVSKVSVNWKIYRSTDGTYEIAYPSDWFVKVNGEFVEISNVAVFGELSDETLQNESFFQISYRDNQAHWPIEKWFKNTLEFISQSHSSTSIDNRPAIRWIPAEGVGARVGYAVQMQDRIIDITYNDQKKFAEIYEHMISSMRLNEIPAATSTSTR